MKVLAALHLAQIRVEQLDLVLQLLLRLYVSVGSCRGAPAEHDVRALNHMLLLLVTLPIDYELVAGDLRVGYGALMAMDDGRRGALVMGNASPMVRATTTFLDHLHGRL